MGDRRKKIIYLASATGADDYGGRIHQTESKFWLSKKYDVLLIPDDIELKEERKATISNFSRSFHFLRLVIDGLRKFKSHDIELIYARHGIATIPGIFLAKLRNSPIIIEINGILFDDVPILGPNYHLKLLLNRIDRAAAKYANHLVVVTPGLKKYYESEFIIDTKKITYIPNGANTDIFKSAGKEKSQKELRWPDGKYILFVGNLAPWQGVDTLIRASVEIAKEVPNMKIVIIGEGAETSKLKQLSKELEASNLIEFKGHVDYESIPKYISASDVCVAPFASARNDKIGLSPLKIYEYAACGKPIVASNIENLEFIEKNKMGILVPPENHIKLGEAIIHLLKNPDEMEDMGRNGIAEVHEHYSWDRITERLARLFETIMNSE